MLQALTFPMLRLLLSKAHGRKDFENHLKSAMLVLIHLLDLAEYCQMSTHMTGFQPFFSVLASFCTGQISHRHHKD